MGMTDKLTLRKGIFVIMKSVEDRFWEKVDIGEEDECWEWMAYRDRRGYGHFCFDSQSWLAHRMTWTLTYEEIPEGLCVLHHCDNPACCNPNHLFLGTRADNSADMRTKKRERQPPKGELNGRAKLTKANVLEIRRLWNETNLHQGEIGEMFGVAQTTISGIVRDEYWTHV